MTDQEIKIAVAELCGWKYPCRPCFNNVYNRWRNPEDTGCVTVDDLPNYPNDLNACHEMEAFIPPGKRGYYNAELAKVVCNRTLSAVVKEPEFIFMLIRASERQRCEAFLRVHGKWKD